MGKLIVIEGTDGSGKSTQFHRLTDRLRHEGRAFQQLVFPQYQEESSALIRMYLNGEFGTSPSDVNAYAASAFFAVDRGRRYGSTLFCRSPGRKPRRSPASTAGRVRIIRFTVRSRKAATAAATAK